MVAIKRGPTLCGLERGDELMHIRRLIDLSSNRGSAHELLGYDIIGEKEDNASQKSKNT